MDEKVILRLYDSKEPVFTILSILSVTKNMQRMEGMPAVNTEYMF
jgi:hypothetical protein